MTRRKILNILFWIALIAVVILILWRIFGNSPSDLSIIIGLGSMILFKIWAISDDFKDFKYEVKSSFTKAKTDISNLKTDFKELSLKPNRK